LRVQIKGSIEIGAFAEKISDWQARRSFLSAVVASTLLLLLFALVGRLSGETAVRILYLLPIWLAIRLDGRRGGFTMVAVVVGTIMAEDVQRGVPTVLSETVFRALSFAGVAWIISRVESRLADSEKWARRDPLTGVFNRRALDEFWKERNIQETTNSAYVVVMIDCDGFKSINDRYGHEAGDRVLQLLGQVLESETRRSDFAARVGGDEFVLVLKETVPREARRILHRIESVFESRVLDAGYACSLSVGYAPVESFDQSMQDILMRADREMYRNKELKRAAAFLN